MLECFLIDVDPTCRISEWGVLDKVWRTLRWYNMKKGVFLFYNVSGWRFKRGNTFLWVDGGEVMLETSRDFSFNP